MKRDYQGADGPQETTLLEYHCGVCGGELTDDEALLTSCGHFFCVTKTCTALVPGVSGRCEQCGRQCDAGTLTNQAAGYDDHVRSFVFSDPIADIKEIIEILEVHCHRFRHALGLTPVDFILGRPRS